MVAYTRPAFRRHEEATLSTVTPTDGVFNISVIFDQHLLKHSQLNRCRSCRFLFRGMKTSTALTFRTAKPGFNGTNGKPFTPKTWKCPDPSHPASSKVAGQPRQIMCTEISRR